MDKFTIIVPEEDRKIVVVKEEFVIVVPGEIREIEVVRHVAG